jgi:hypothetical protein
MLTDPAVPKATGSSTISIARTPHSINRASLIARSCYQTSRAVATDLKAATMVIAGRGAAEGKSSIPVGRKDPATAQAMAMV